MHDKAAAARAQVIEFRQPTIYDVGWGQSLNQIASVVAIMMGISVVTAAVISGGDPEEARRLLSLLNPVAAWQKIVARNRSGDMLEVFAWAVASLGFLVHQRLSHRHERLTLGASGIRYVSPWQGGWRWLQKFQPDWMVRWDQIKQIDLAAGKNVSSKPGLVNLIVFGMDGRTRRVHAGGWANKRYAPPSRFKLAFLESAAKSRERVFKHVRGYPLPRALQERGFAFESLSATSVSQLQLKGIEENPYLKGLLVIALAVAPLAAIGFAFTHWTPIGPGIFLCMAAVAVSALLLAYVISDTAPEKERTWVTLIFAAATTGLAYPALMQINVWTSPNGETVHQYESVMPGEYRPLEPGLPELRLKGDDEYWSSFPPHSRHEFVVVSGSLMFYQYDSARIHAERMAAH